MEMLDTGVQETAESGVIIEARCAVWDDNKDAHSPLAHSRMVERAALWPDEM
jgi:hypothetical protein